MQRSVSFGARQLSYEQWGQGAQVLLAFHGYGNDASMYKVLADVLGETYTVLSVDLPHHGNSSWDETPFTKEELMSFLRAIMSQYHAEKIAIAGYSLGGRVCLNIIELMPELLTGVVLIASDGLAFSRFYHFVTHNPIGKKMFRSFLAGNGQYHRIIDWLYRAKLLDASRYKFLMHYLSTQQARDFVLNVWPNMRLLIPDLAVVKEHISRRQLPVHLFMGKHDRIIPLKLGRSFAAGMKTVQLHILDRGHRLFDPASIRQIAECLR